MRSLWLGDTRLLGTWRSDGERTAAELNARIDIDSDRKARLSALFGKLDLRYTRRYCYSTLDGRTERIRCRVVARDAESAAVITYGSFGPTVHQIHFDGDAYWITLGSSNIREFFRRIC